jgi:hypothetical protein
MKRIKTKLVGTALAVVVASGCTPTVEGGSAGSEASPRLTEADQRFIKVGRHMTNRATCIAASEKSVMTSPNPNELDNADQAARAEGKTAEQPIHVNISREKNQGDAYGDATWIAHYSPPPGQDTFTAMHVEGTVSSNSAFWHNSQLPTGQTGLGLPEAHAGASDIVSYRLGAVANTIGIPDITVEQRTGQNKYQYFYTPEQPVPHSGPLSPEELDMFLDNAVRVADHLLELSGMKPAECDQS